MLKNTTKSNTYTNNKLQYVHNYRDDSLILSKMFQPWNYDKSHTSLQVPIFKFNIYTHKLYMCR